MKDVTSPMNQLYSVVIKRFKREARSCPKRSKCSHVVPKVDQSVSGFRHPSLTYFLWFFFFFFLSFWHTELFATKEGGWSVSDLPYNSGYMARYR